MAGTREAGQALKDIREHTYGWTQRDVSNKSRERWGDEGEIDQAVLSKIERGALAKPLNLREAAVLCVLYNKPLSWLAELYGLPVVQVEAGHFRETVVQRLANVLDQLPARSARREQLIRWVDFAIQQTLAGMGEEKGA